MYCTHSIMQRYVLSNLQQAMRNTCGPGDQRILGPSCEAVFMKMIIIYESDVRKTVGDCAFWVYISESLLYERSL